MSQLEFVRVPVDLLDQWYHAKPWYGHGMYYAYSRCFLIARTSSDTWVLRPTAICKDTLPLAYTAFRQAGLQGVYFPRRADAVMALENVVDE